ncbi:MAG: prepilin peptidase [Rhodospirillaceae bacterium]|nr:prepilin peptidase [Rhodospirillaceae bacterium]
MSDSGVAVVVALFGLAVGSFLNVCVHRLPRGASVVAPGSHCPACRRSLRWFDNVPVVAYLLLRGRCRACRAPISPVYPLVEAATAGLFLVQWQVLGLQPLLAPRLLFTAAMIVLFVVDLRHHVLPHVITLPGIAVGALEPGWFETLAGALAGGGSLLVIAKVYSLVRGREGLGMGDVKMLAMIGAFLGLPLAFVTLAWASLLGAVVGIGMIRLTGAGWQHPLPLGSFLAAAAVAASLVGDPFLDWYFAGAERLLQQFANP